MTHQPEFGFGVSASAGRALLSKLRGGPVETAGTQQVRERHQTAVLALDVERESRPSESRPRQGRDRAPVPLPDDLAAGLDTLADPFAHALSGAASLAMVCVAVAGGGDALEAAELHDCWRDADRRIGIALAHVEALRQRWPWLRDRSAEHQNDAHRFVDAVRFWLVSSRHDARRALLTACELRGWPCP
ncbi:MAG: hypothetical protein SangKO_031980 [Sandaracinaceae bacterium]